MYKFEIIEIDNPKWNEIVKKSSIYDFHHTSFYHRIDNDFRSVLFYVEKDNNFIALPLVIRPIESTDWFDMTSVYGYCGFITNQNIEEDLLFFFKDNFKAYCKENNIISVFSRLHPIINQKSMFSDFGCIEDLNKTVAIDLRLTPEEQRKQYRKSNKSEINQLKRKGFSVVEAKSNSDIDSFIAIYYETMDRVNAEKYYYFSREYFYDFLSNKFFGNKLLLAKFDNEVVAGAIFTYTDKIMQYHLAGTTENYIRETPMKLLLDEARLLGNELGLEFLHLGGGVGGSDEDSLFRFKSGFSDLYCQFSVWKYIIDEEKYNALLVKKGLVSSESSFFPLYRKGIY